MKNYLTCRDLSDGLFEDLFNDSLFTRNNKHLMKTDIKEDDKKYDIEVEMPGFNKDNIKISLDHGYLTIEAIVEEEKENNKHYILRERHSTSMSRSYYVGDDLKEEDITAKFENGILNLEIQKKEPVKEEKKFIQIA